MYVNDMVADIANRFGDPRVSRCTAHEIEFAWTSANVAPVVCGRQQIATCGQMTGSGELSKRTSLPIDQQQSRPRRGGLSLPKHYAVFGAKLPFHSPHDARREQLCVVPLPSALASLGP